MVKAICVVTGESVKGTITFVQEEGKPLVVEGEIQGLKEGKHGKRRKKNSNQFIHRFPYSSIW